MSRIKAGIGLLLLATTLIAASASPADARWWPKFRMMGGCPMWDFIGDW